MIDTLGKAMLAGSLDAILFGAIAFLVCRSAPRLAAELRAGLWWLVCAKALLAALGLAPIGLLALSTEQAPERPTVATPARAGAETLGWSADRKLGAETVARGQAPVAAPASSPTRSSSEGIGRSVSTVLAGGWLLGVLLLVGIGGRRHLALRAAVRDAPTVDPGSAIGATVARLAGTLRLARPPRVALLAVAPGPFVVGLLRPTLVLPPRCLALPRAELDAVLCHELSHLVRRDLLLGLVPLAARALFFFHPLVVLANREYSFAREAACDALVLRTLGATPRDYGALLLRWGTDRRKPALVAAAAASSARHLARRLDMLRFAHDRKRLGPLTVLAVLTALAPVTLLARTAGSGLFSHDEAPSRRTHATAPTAPTAPTPPPTPTPVAAAPAASRGPATPPVAAAPPVPPVPAVPRMTHARGSGAAWIVLTDDHQTFVNGSRAQRDRVASLHAADGKPLLWFERDGGEYLVRDPGLVGRAVAAWRQVGEIGEQQGELGGRQGELGARQGEIGRRQGEIGARQGEIGARQGEIGARIGALAARLAALRIADPSDPEADRLEAELDQLTTSIEALAHGIEPDIEEIEHLAALQAELAGHQAKLGADMEVLAANMARASERAEDELDAIIAEALSRGLATRLQGTAQE